jgi:NAD(P)-dependent dehydrogenase (short-subunit alcohol dehydrogenase family)
MRGLAGRTAIVTGGGNGIGRQTCEELVGYGAHVAIADTDARAAQRCARDLNSAAPGGACPEVAIAVSADVTDEDAVRRLVATTMSRFGSVDILVNCAGVLLQRGIEATVEEWRLVLDVNVIGTALCVKHVAPEMVKAGRGAIVNISSISAAIAQPHFLTYSATKGAVSSMTRCMALDLAPYGIRVNAVCPGTVWTERNASLISQRRGLDRPAADKDPVLGGAHMLGRVADPAEISSAIAFLASDEARFVTAENLMVDGGYTAR